MHEEIKVNSNRLRSDFLGKIVARVGSLIFSTLAKISCHGAENLHGLDACVLAANHQTFVDGLFIAKGLSREQKTRLCALAAADLATEYGLFGKLMLRFCPIIPVDRSSKRASIKTLIKARNACQDGNIVLVHPEGTRTPDGKIGQILSGASYIAIKTNKPLVPIYIAGGYQFFSRHDALPKIRDKRTHRRHDIHVYYLQPLHPADYIDVHALNQALEDALRQAETKFGINLS